MRLVMFPTFPQAAAVVSDEDGHTVAIFFPQSTFKTREQQREDLREYVEGLLLYNGIIALSVREESSDE